MISSQDLITSAKTLFLFQVRSHSSFQGFGVDMSLGDHIQPTTGG